MTEFFTLKSEYDGLGISVMVSRPSGEPHGVLLLAHGMRGCKERFLPLVGFMTSYGYICVANDHRGHGSSVRSSEDLGFMYEGGAEALVEDMRQVREWIGTSFPSLPVFLLGHSMGSLAARVYAKKYDDSIKGLIICGSPSENPLSELLLWLSDKMCRIDGGHYRPRFIQNLTSAYYNRRFFMEGPEAWTCSDQYSRRSFASNPVCGRHFTANGTRCLLTLMHETYSGEGWKTSHPDLPVLFLSGEDDPCMTSEKRFHKSVLKMCKAGYTDVSSAIYPSMRHEILHEKGKHMVWLDILDNLERWRQN